MGSFALAFFYYRLNESKSFNRSSSVVVMRFCFILHLKNCRLRLPISIHQKYLVVDLLSLFPACIKLPQLEKGGFDFVNIPVFTQLLTFKAAGFHVALDWQLLWRCTSERYVGKLQGFNDLHLHSSEKMKVHSENTSLDLYIHQYSNTNPNYFLFG